MKSYAVVFVAWGEQFVQQVESCIQQSKALHGHDIILITDEETVLDGLLGNFSQVIRAPFETEHHLRKAEMIKFLPDGFDVYLFLDSDTAVIEDISLGFEKADTFGIAMAPAPHYSIDYFWGFDRIMEREGIDCKGQLLYNSGVIFFKKSSEVRSVFSQWMALAQKYQHEMNNDQPFLSLAMEKLGFNPYTLSISYNYRGFGDAISGVVRVWHSHGAMPENVNEFKKAWPPRRAWPGKITYDGEDTKTPSAGLLERVKQALRI